MLGPVTPMDLEIIVSCLSFMTGDIEAASKWGVALVIRFKIVMGQNQHRGRGEGSTILKAECGNLSIIRPDC
jgi:hypothetical protein